MITNKMPENKMVIKNNYIKKHDFDHNNYYNMYKKIKIITKFEGDREWAYITDKNFLISLFTYVDLRIQSNMVQI